MALGFGKEWILGQEVGVEKRKLTSGEAEGKSPSR